MVAGFEGMLVDMSRAQDGAIKIPWEVRLSPSAWIPPQQWAATDRTDSRRSPGRYPAPLPSPPVL